MLIEVTESDIKNGKKGKCRSCPVALAFRRKIKATNLATYWKIVSIDGEFYCLPESASKFIMAFDWDGKVEPFSFEFEMSESNKVQIFLNSPFNRRIK